MKTLTVEVEIASDGTLHLDIPSGLPPGKAEVILVIQPVVLNNRFMDYLGQSERTGDIDAHLSDADSTHDEELIAQMSQKEKAMRLAELLDFALEGVEWSEIEKGRRDRWF